jgi:molecular chaperone DnaK (HSP70)
LWCLTIPAIWSDVSKSCMRVAAQRAGLISQDPADQDRLLLVLEPEAAALYCMEKAVHISDGERFMVLDCGGGTIDITIHERTPTGLRELCPGVGGPYGATTIDKAILDYVRKQLTPEALTVFEQRHPVDYLYFLDNIELAKCQFGRDAETTVYLKLPNTLDRILHQQQFSGVLRVLLEEQGDDQQIHLTPELMKRIFEEKIAGVIDTVDTAIGQLKSREIGTRKPLDYIFMVGGFSESKYLRQLVNERCSTICPRDVVVPKLPAGAVLHGAVLFGLEPSLIRSRRSRLTYGTRISRPFVRGDPESKKTSFAGNPSPHCNDVFDQVCLAGEEIGIDETRARTYHPAGTGQRSMRIDVYATRRTDARYTDENGMEKLGELTVSMQDLRGDRNRQVRVEYLFGRTEITVRVTDLTSNERVEHRFDLYYSYSSDVS